MLQAGRIGILAAMNPSPGAKILILTDRQASARRWADALRQPGDQLWLGRHEMPPAAEPEVIVTDRDLSGDPRPGPPPERSAAPVGLIRVGGSGRADVELPEDVTPRELCLACRLLAEIVRLRRRLRAGAELRRRLSEAALTDPLTGLPNRRAWDLALRERLAVRRGRQRLCLAIFDLDHFKRINDAHGHAVGDEVLRATGRSIRQGLRQHDFVARLGGDEFGLLFWAPDESTGEMVVDRVRTALPSRLMHVATPAVTASAGYHLVPSAGSRGSPVSPDAHYAAADAALREAKRRGRDRTLGAGDR
jgi:diguanylate cyclase (GGDEF)-like protein